MSKIDTKVKTYEIVFKEKQTVTLEDGNGEIIKNVLAFSFAITYGESKKDIRKAFKDNKLVLEWNDADDYPNGECVEDVIDIYDREIYKIKEVI